MMKTAVGSASMGKVFVLMLGCLGGVGAATSCHSATEWIGDQVPGWRHGGTPTAVYSFRSAAAGIGAQSVPGKPVLRSAQGSFTLEFIPNGEGVEVDAPTDIAYSLDGQFILVAAKGKSPLPGAANLSVYAASDMSLVRIIPLTYAPEKLAAVADPPRAVLTNAENDSVTIVDYETGVELAVVPVGAQPIFATATPQGTAVIQGLALASETSWSIINLSSNTETARFPAPGAGGNLVAGLFCRFLVAQRPMLVAGGDKVATMNLESPAVAIVDLSTQQVSNFPLPVDVEALGDLASTPDGSLVAVTYFVFDLETSLHELHVFTLDTSTLQANDYMIALDPFPYSARLLIKPDRSRIVVGRAATLDILDTGDGSVEFADVSGFPYGLDWSLVANIAGDGFLVWFWGGGDKGYQIFDWDGSRTAELVGPGLGGGDAGGDISTQLFAVSPTSNTHLAFVDPALAGEDVVQLDLTPSAPQILGHELLGDGIEGDAVTVLLASNDKSVAFMVNAQSSNAAFIDLNTMTNTGWRDIPKYVTDAALTPDGNTAVLVAGAWYAEVPIAGANRLTLLDRAGGNAVDVPLPADAYGRALAIDASGAYAYTLLATPGEEGAEVARVDLVSQQLDSERLPVPLPPTQVPLILGFDSDRASLEINLGAGGEGWAAQSHDGQLLAVASTSSEGMVTLVDKTAWSVLADVSLGSDGLSPFAMAFSPDDSRLYVTSQQAISAIDVNGVDSNLAWQVPEQLLPTIVSLSPDGSKLYVGILPFFGSANYNIQVLDTSTGESTATIALPVQDDMGFPPSLFGLLNAPVRFCWSEGGSLLYVFSLNDEVHVIDPSIDQVIESVATGFFSPTSVIALTESDSEKRFLLASFNGSNDGLALLTIQNPGADMIFQSGFEAK